jgi:hypothetical protein
MNNSKNTDFPNNSPIFPKICWLHLMVYSIILLLLLINFILTYNNFSENKFIQMSPSMICNVFIKEHNLCLNKFRNQTEPNEITEECVGANLRLQSCYDKVQIYNEKCFLYFSEFDKCVSDKRKESKEIDFLRTQCQSEIEDINRCIEEFISFEPFLLLDLQN